MASNINNNTSADTTITEGYLFEWKNQTVHFKTTLEAIRNAEQFTDVTIKCDGGQIKAHKVVLSIFSSYFQDLFLENESSNPIIILKDSEYADINGIIQYIYTGKVTVDKKNVGSFLKVANLFKVKGLSDYLDFQPSLYSTTSNSASITTTTNETSSANSGFIPTENQNVSHVSKHVDKKTNGNLQITQLSNITSNNENPSAISNSSKTLPSTCFSLSQAPTTKLLPVTSKSSRNVESDDKVRRAISKVNVVQNNQSSSKETLLTQRNDEPLQNHTTNGNEIESDSVTATNIVMSPLPSLIRPSTNIPKRRNTKIKESSFSTTTAINNNNNKHLQDKQKQHIVSNVKSQTLTTTSISTPSKNSESGNFKAPIDGELNTNNDNSKITSALNQETSQEKDGFLGQLDLKRTCSPPNNNSEAITNNISSTVANSNNAVIAQSSLPPKKRRFLVPPTSPTLQEQTADTKFNVGSKNSSISTSSTSSLSSATNIYDNSSTHVNKSKEPSSNDSLNGGEKVAENENGSSSLKKTATTSIMTTEKLPSLPPLIPNPNLNKKSISSVNNKNTKTSGKKRKVISKTTTLKNTTSATSSSHTKSTKKSVQTNNKDNNLEIDLEISDDDECLWSCAHPDRRCDRGSYVCQHCKRRYVQKRSLTDHLKAHEGETWCAPCEKWFSKPSNLRAHQKQKHGGANQTKQ